MWGYKNDRYLYYGWAAARLDDVLMWIPARLTAFSYALCGHAADALKCWMQQGTKWYSPNAGPVMAAGAGALRVLLGGNAVYGGTTKQRIVLGCGKPPNFRDIDRAIHLVFRALLVWVVVVSLTEVFVHA
jgi:adenosylcobinamide-phosphate synthase